MNERTVIQLEKWLHPYNPKYYRCGNRLLIALQWYSMHVHTYTTLKCIYISQYNPRSSYDIGIGSCNFRPLPCAQASNQISSSYLANKFDRHIGNRTHGATILQFIILFYAIIFRTARRISANEKVAFINLSLKQLVGRSRG